MDTKKLRQKILDLAIRGKLVPQDPNDEPASVLLERIRAEKERLIKEGKKKGSKKKSQATSDKPHYENRQVGEANEVPFEVPESWEWTNLGDITNYGNCENVDVNDIPKEGWVLELEDLEKDSAKIIKQLTKDERDIKGVRHSFHKGDVLYSKLRTYLNKVMVANEDGFCTTEIIPITCMSYVLPEYLNHVLRSKYFVDYTIQCGYGVKMPRLSTTDACNGQIPLPPYNEQKHIVASIEGWFQLVDILESDQADLDEAIQKAKSKILDLAIHGKLVPQDPNDEPATDLLKRINPKFTPCDNAHCPYDIPGNWYWCKLIELCSFLSRGKSPTYSEERKYPVFAQKCNLYGGGISLDQARFLDPNTLSKWPEDYKLLDGDVLVNSTGTGTVGRTRLFHSDCLGSYPFVVPDSHVSVIRTVGNIDSDYIYSIVSSRYGQEYIEDNLAGSTNQKELYIGVLENMLIPLPPYDEQRRIASKLKESFAILEAIQDSIEA